jgi:2-dehydro-3-deoxyphosphogluconate aldolase / (4S)-4-hydroxy-2-oxoglutarate aldolase
MKDAEHMNAIENPGIIPVMRLSSTESLFPLIEALIAGGISCAELTMTIPNAIDVLAKATKQFKGRISLGMGTVAEAEDAEAAIAAGAEFLVSPFLAFDALKAAKAKGVPFIMGAFSPSEIRQAWKAGADYVKIFPLETLGPRYVKHVKGPLPEVKIIPTGGVTLENLALLMKFGVSAVGVGGEIVDGKAIKSGDWGGISAKARSFVDEIAKARKSLQGA